MDHPQQFEEDQEGYERWCAERDAAAPPQQNASYPTDEELHRYRNDVVFHELVGRLRNYVEMGLGRYEDVIAAAEFCRKVHWKWSCEEHDRWLPGGQPCPRCLEQAGDLLADCLPDVGRNLGIPKKILDESTGPNYGAIHE